MALSAHAARQLHQSRPPSSAGDEQRGDGGFALRTEGLEGQDGRVIASVDEGDERFASFGGNGGEDSAEAKDG